MQTTEQTPDMAFVTTVMTAVYRLRAAQDKAMQLALASIRGDHETRADAYVAFVGGLMCIEADAEALHQAIALLVTLDQDPVGRLAVDAAHDGRMDDLAKLAGRCLEVCGE